ncbi:MAG: hypothetical protein SGJ19_15465, partial [Planctomycetia bacterium]|nr:hypothetical protein [Planctomycetia bacterium]
GWEVELEWMGRRGAARRQRVMLRATYPGFGGVRWWWECGGVPRPRWERLDGGLCLRRTGTLYLRERRWACRACHGLTYQSCRDSGKRHWVW